jgi:glycosyltransferase involved in cell wall biosynthesis
MLAYAFYESDMRILRYANALTERGDVVDVIALRREGAAAFEVLDGVNVYRIQTRERNERGWFDYLIRILRFMFASTIFLTRKHLSRPYDLIHVHSVPDFLVFSAVAPKLLGAKVILDIHDILPEFFASKFSAGEHTIKFKLLLWAEYLSIRFSNHVIIANDLWRERLVRRSAEDHRCTSIINYPDTRIFYRREELRPHDGRFRMTYPGTLNSHQGVDIAIRAVAELHHEMPELQFHIYGEGPERSALMELSAGLNLSDAVIFHHFLPCNRIADAMAMSDIAVVPKRAASRFGNEAMSTKIMEFMSLGIPVIVSDTRIDRYCHDETRVRFFESDNVADLAASIRALRNDDRLCEQLAQNAFAYVQASSWNQKRHVYLDLTDELCTSNIPIASSATGGTV